MRQRVLTSVALAPIVLLAAALISPWPVFALCSVVLFLALEETRRMLGRHWPAFVPAIAFLALSYLLIAGKAAPALLVETASALFALGVGSAWWTIRTKKLTLIGEALDGLWAAMPVFLLLALHQSQLGAGLWDFSSPLLLVLLPVWAGDIAAIFVGKAFGRHLFAPTISPKKTWEGAIGNLIAAVATGTALGSLMHIPSGWLCGLAAGVCGQAGDLFESYAKRQAGIKDSGTLLPGHGGIMDRIDSILFAAPFVALILAFLG